MQPEDDVFAAWFTAHDVPMGADSIRYLVESNGEREAIWPRLLERVRSHYLAPETLAVYCEQLGYDEAADALRVLTPTDTKTRSGELGEILATEYINETLATKVYVKRMRSKDERNTSMRGDDLIGVHLDDAGRLLVLKGESKSRTAMTIEKLLEAEEKLLENDGRPSQHSAGVIANILVRTNLPLGIALTKFNSRKRDADELSHIIVALTQSKPRLIFPTFLKRAYKTGITRRLVALIVKDHQKTIARLFDDLTKPQDIARQYGAE